jgi:hypothetical protein
VNQTLADWVHAGYACPPYKAILLAIAGIIDLVYIHVPFSTYLNKDD